MDTIRAHVRTIVSVWQYVETVAAQPLPAKGATRVALQIDAEMRSHALMVAADLFLPIAIADKQGRLIQELDQQLSALEARLTRRSRRRPRSAPVRFAPA